MSKPLPRLIEIHRYADARWEKALKRKGYPSDDDAEESAAAGRPHSPHETLCVAWAGAWRSLLHATEEAMLKDPEVRRGLVEGSQLREQPTPHEPTVL